MTLEQMKAEYLAEAAARWDKAAEEIRQYLNHELHEARELTELLLTAHEIDLYEIFRDSGYGVPFKFINRMEFVKFFVGHELLDDGDPGFAEKGFKVTFNQIRGPNARPLTLEIAIKALKDYAERRDKRFRNLESKIQPSTFEREKLAQMKVDREKQKELLSLIEELKA